MSEDVALCDARGCDEAWIFDGGGRRRCHRHWLEDLEIAPRESFTIVREITPRASDPPP